MKIETLQQKVFEEILKELNAPNNIDLDYLYEIYDAVINGINLVMDSAKNYTFNPVNHVVVILYIVNEYLYSVSGLNDSDKANFKDSEDLSSALASVCCDKYLTNEQLNYKSPIFLNKFNPQISTMSLYLNFTLTTMNKISVTDNVSDLIKRMLSKAFSLGKCILELLINGFETEAFSTWRTLHENESIITCLMRYGKPIIDEYFKHITYALAYRHQMSQDEQDKVFEQIKDEMHSHDLKSKDMKKFIEYGYLYAISDFDEQMLKLNFRDGVQKAAGLSTYSKTYEMSSEIAHSSPLLLLTQNGYFSTLTLLSLYESFFRLEKIFESFFKTYSSPDDFKKYETLRKVYMNQLIVIYNNTKTKFINERVGKESKSSNEDND